MIDALHKRVYLGWQWFNFLKYVNRAVHEHREQIVEHDYFPWMLYLQTHNKCNGECTICPYVNLYRDQPRKEIEWGLFQKIIQEGKERLGLHCVVFGLHSEPLLDTRIIEFIRYVKNTKREIIVMLFTNGALLNSRIASELIRAGLDCIKINLPSLDKDVFSAINRGLDYNTVIDNIKEFIRLAKGAVLTRVSITVTTQNREVLSIASRIRKWGAKPEFNILSNRCGQIKEFKQYFDSTVFHCRERNFLHDIIFNGCWFPFYAAHVTCEGKVLMCCNDWNQTLSLGNLYKQNLWDIWNGDSLRKIRQMLRHKQYDKVALCNSCYLVEKKIFDSGGVKSHETV